MQDALMKKGGTRIINLSAPSNERTAVMKNCISCGRDVAVASDFSGLVLCSEKCHQEYQKADEHVRDVLLRWANSEPDFYRSTYNVQKLVDYIQANGLEWTTQNLKLAFRDLSAQKKLLSVISLEDLRAMGPEEYSERLRLDPDLGGFREQVDKGALSSTQQRRPVESAQPGFEPGNRVSALQRAAEREQQDRAAAHANRYETQAFSNGRSVPAPELQQGLQVFRNGRVVR